MRASELEHVIVRAAQLDDARVEEGLPIRASEEAVVAEELRATTAEAAEEGAVGVRDDAAKKHRIHPRDVARFAVSSLCDDAPAAGTGRTVEVHTFVIGEAK